MRWIRFAAAFAVVATVYFYRLDRPLLWGDEAHTGALAHGILKTGLPTAFDGRNVVLFDIRAGLNRHLISKEVPWVQWYVGAASLALFGNSTAGLRILFALAGLLAFVPLWAVLRGRVKAPEFVTALALIAPQAALFQRNARYYPIVVLLFACLVWHLHREFKSRRAWFGSAVLIFVLLFHTHTLVALCIAASLAAFCLLWRRRDLAGYLAAAGIGFLSWLAWYKLLGPPLAASPLFQAWDPVSGLASWCAVFARGVLTMFVDMDVVGSLPLLLLAAVVGVFLVRDRKGLLALCREPLFGFVLIGVVVQAAATAAVSGTETAARVAVLRYMPHFAVFATVACLLALDRLVRRVLPFAALCALVVASNLATFSFWARPFGREVPVSWAARVYPEIFNPAPEAWDGVIADLRRQAPPAWSGDRAIIAVPAWTEATLIFYVGDLYIIPPDFVHQPGPHDNQGESYIRETMGDAAFGRLSALPEWLVDALNFFGGAAPGGLTAAGFYPSHRARTDDGTRPELTRHSFAQPAPVSGIGLYRWPAE
jgi:hypothetical protein